MGKGRRGTVRTCCVPVTHIGRTLPYCHRAHVTPIAYRSRFPLRRRYWRGLITEPSPDLLICTRPIVDIHVVGGTRWGTLAKGSRLCPSIMPIREIWVRDLFDRT